MIRNAERTHFSLAALGAGLVSASHPGAQDYGRRLIQRCSIEVIAERTVEFVRFLIEQKCLAFMPGVRDHFDDPRFAEMWRLCEVLDGVTAIRIDTLGPVFTLLHSAGVEVMPIKGFDMIYAFPNASGKRFIQDADPLIRPDDLGRAHQIVLDAGFKQGEIDSSRPNADGTGPYLIPLESRDLDWMLQNHHQAHAYYKFVHQEWLNEHVALLERYVPETVPIVDGKPYVSAAFDLHFSIASGFDESDQWPSRRVVTLPDGLEYPGLDPEAYLCLYLGRAYSVTQAFHDPHLQTIADAARVTAASEVDWSRFAELVKKYRLYAPAYYGLSQLSAILCDQKRLPDDQVAFFRDLLDANPDYDLGDFSARFLSTVNSTPFADVLG
ncbi:nucleotidyltransferase family protein [Streptomyces sp. NPDC050508]|uniref:nucleotidyltransferase family protein n=1 Tax=Streptomyces sp. NPDC050508 TaxID=3155405 RepID=UPI00341552EA